jgi:hypothetical protein
MRLAPLTQRRGKSGASCCCRHAVPGDEGRARHSVRAVAVQNQSDFGCFRVAGAAHGVTRPATQPWRQYHDAPREGRQHSGSSTAWLRDEGVAAPAKILAGSKSFPTGALP